MNKALIRRVQAIEQECAISEDVGIVLGLIAKGAYYDELTDSEKSLYCQYLGSDRDSFENLHGYVCGSLHIKLERRPRQATDAEFRKNVLEVEAFFNDKQKEYNSQEARSGLS